MAASTATDGTAAAYQPPEGAESYKFEAEVDRMLDIVVNSLYTNKDVFLREVCMRPAALSAWICLASFCPDSINPVQ